MKIKQIIQFCFLLALIYIILVTCQKDRTLSINNNKLTVEIADTKEKRTKGLMFRTSLGMNAGMLFVFEDNKVLTFWMKNTFIPLSIAFVDTNCRIIKISDMQPLDEDSFHSSLSPAKYALEVNQGWFIKHNIKIGDKVRGLEKK